jgi:hypothetical protein
MNNESKNDYCELLANIWQFHSILNTAWPKPGIPQMTGASVFLHTNLFKALENGLIRIQQLLKPVETSNGFLNYWEAFYSLFMRLKEQDRAEKSERIDRAINMLYLASGVLYHQVAMISSKLPDCDKRLIGVEDFSKLLQLCRWSDSGNTIDSVFDDLPSKMTSILHEFD